MLVLTREIGESIIIGEGENAVRVTIRDIRGLKVRVGISAPDDVKVDREEVRIAHEREAKLNDELRVATEALLKPV